MALVRSDVDFRRLSADELQQWRAIPPAVASDCMNRTQAMNAAIKPVLPDMVLCGQARTVTTMVGDCGAVCALMAAARPGEVLVIDAGAVADTAVWGGVMTAEAVQRKLGGAVIDGAIRDVADVRKSGFPLYCRAVVPRGPHHGFGGSLDVAVSVAGAPIRPGDIVLGDADGVVVVPLERAAEVLKAAQAHLIVEEEWMMKIRDGISIAEMYSMPSAK
jgi:4-hydroxy-4-methyl-2-oxoglutarate aldolase